MKIDLMRNRIVDIDLQQRIWTSTLFPQEAIETFLGGRGWNASLLYQQLAEVTAPLSPENLLVFSNGLLTGTRMPASSRLHISALSPQTGLLGSSNVGGDFGAVLHACQIHSLVIRGRSDSPVYLVIESDGVHIRDASRLWGLDTWETEEVLKRELSDERIHLMTIGPGGENGAAFGCIMTDRDHAAGRTGMGTIMGSKRLKAIVVIPPSKPFIEPISREGQSAITRYIRQIRHTKDFDTLSKYGGAGQVVWCDEMGLMPAYNYHDNHFDAIARLDSAHLENDIIKIRGCRRCPIQCKALLQFHTGKYADLLLARPEFEPMLTFGPKCGSNDLETVVYLDNLCSRLGLDSISTGTAIAFAMDLYNRGLLTTDDTGGLGLKWGDGAVMETLIRQIAYQEGFGKILAQGVRKAAQIIGKGSYRFAPQVKGLELSAYNPREIMGTALGYAVSSRGGDFNHVYPSLEYRWSPEKAQQEFHTPLAVDIHATQGKGLLVKRAMIVNAVLDSLGLCKVPALSLLGDFDLKREAELLSIFYDRSLGVSELFTIGERIITVERLFNQKHGATWRDDTLPPMFLDNKTPSIPLESMLQDFYAAMGWDEQGVPRQRTLQKLGLEDLIRS